MITVKPKFYFSFRSPYSWLAWETLEKQFPFAAETVQLIPYWEPDPVTSTELGNARFLYSPMSREKHLYILQDIKRLCGKLGKTVKWPVDRNPWWEHPHLGYLKAARLGQEKEFMRSIYHARFCEGRNICEDQAVMEAASEAGMDPSGFTSAVLGGDAELRQEGVEALKSAYEDGVFGIPFFSLGRQKFWGLDRVGDFVEDLALDSALVPGG